MSIYDTEFTAEDAASADKAASRLDTGGAYDLTIVRVQFGENRSGSKSAELFLTDDGGKVRINHSVVVEDAEGKAAWGLPILKGVAFLAGVKLRAPVTGLGEFWEDSKRVEKEGLVFKGFEGKKI